MRDHFMNALFEAATIDSSICLVTGDLGYGVVDEFALKLPSQFINAGVDEQSMLSMAAGIASTGKRVFVYSIANFPTMRCLEQIRNDVCAMNNAVTVVSVGAGFSYGAHGYSHHAVEDIAIMRALPNINIFSPGDPAEAMWVAKHLTTSNAPSYLRLGKNGEKFFSSPEVELMPGKFREIVCGEDGTILFTGSIGSSALLASSKLREMGKNVSVASVPFISDLDLGYLEKSLLKGPLLTLEEHSPRGGFGSAILEEVHKHPQWNKNRIGILAASQSNISLVGSQDYLRDQNGLGVRSIVEAFLGL